MGSSSVCAGVMHTCGGGAASVCYCSAAAAPWRAALTCNQPTHPIGTTLTTCARPRAWTASRSHTTTPGHSWTTLSGATASAAALVRALVCVVTQVCDNILAAPVCCQQCVADCYCLARKHTALMSLSACPTHPLSLWLSSPPPLATHTHVHANAHTTPQAWSTLTSGTTWRATPSHPRTGLQSTCSKPRSPSSPPTSALR
jgi:hypothetical protein